MDGMRNVGDGKEPETSLGILEEKNECDQPQKLGRCEREENDGAGR